MCVSARYIMYNVSVYVCVCDFCFCLLRISDLYYINVLIVSHAYVPYIDQDKHCRMFSFWMLSSFIFHFSFSLFLFFVAKFICLGLKRRGCVRVFFYVASCSWRASHTTGQIVSQQPFIHTNYHRLCVPEATAVVGSLRYVGMAEWLLGGGWWLSWCCVFSCF